MGTDGSEFDQARSTGTKRKRIPDVLELAEMQLILRVHVRGSEFSSDLRAESRRSTEVQTSLIRNSRIHRHNDLHITQ
jgi:hypothetical protein